MISIVLYKEDQSIFNIESLILILQKRFNIKNIHSDEGFLIEFECDNDNKSYRISMSSPDAIFIASDLDQGVFQIGKTIDKELGDIRISNMDFAFDFPLSNVRSYQDLLELIH